MTDSSSRMAILATRASVDAWISSENGGSILKETLLGHRTLWELAQEYGAYVCFHKKHTTSEDLDRAIHRAVELVEQMHKEDRQRTG